jgi:hypothetical protein
MSRGWRFQGRVAEWFKAPVLKTTLSGCASSQLVALALILLQKTAVPAGCCRGELRQLAVSSVAIPVAGLGCRTVGAH